MLQSLIEWWKRGHVSALDIPRSCTDREESHLDGCDADNLPQLKHSWLYGSNPWPIGYTETTLLMLQVHLDWIAGSKKCQNVWDKRGAVFFLCKWWQRLNTFIMHDDLHKGDLAYAAGFHFVVVKPKMSTTYFFIVHLPHRYGVSFGVFWGSEKAKSFWWIVFTGTQSLQ